MTVKILKLNDQAEMPIIGFGTWQLTGTEGEKAVTCALEVGYRHIDTAYHYDNHHQVAKAIKQSGIPRENIFITTKLWRDSLRHDEAIAEFKQSLEQLQLDYIDLYLMHWPNSVVPMSEILTALAELKEQGRIKAIGVSNFTISHLREALDTGVEITNNQVEFHPTLYQKELKQFCGKHNIVLTAYSPIAQGEDLRLAEIQQIASKHNISAARVILAWIMSKDIAVIPRSGNPEHIRDNFESVHLELDTEDIELIDNIDRTNRVIKPAFHEFDR